MKKLYVIIASLFLIFQLNAQNALNFDGTNDYVQTSYGGISGTGPRTVEAWIKTPYQSNQEVIVDWGTASTGARFTTNLIGGKLRCEISGQGVTAATTVVGDNQWHHIAVTYDANATPDYRLYADGVCTDSFNLTTTINTGSSVNVRLGVRVDNANYFTGNMDEVRIWNYARTQSQIAGGMGEEICEPQSGLVAYYKLNEGSAGATNSGISTAHDVSGGNHNGTLNGFGLSGTSSNWVNGYPLITYVSLAYLSFTECDSMAAPSGLTTWTTSGTYYDTLQTTMGCDSAITAVVTILNSTMSSNNIVTCESYTSPSGLHTWTTDGTYYDTLTNANGCDSIITINLMILNTSSTISDTVCDSYDSPSGQYTWTTSGTYHDTLTNENGCDSLITINLTVYQSVLTEIVDTACFSYTSPSGNIITTSGIYQDTLSTSYGCDSIISMDITVNNVDTSVTIPPNHQGWLTANAVNATFQWVMCSDTSYAQIPNADSSAFAGGDVDIKVAVIVTQNGCIDTSGCFLIWMIGINEFNASEAISIFPNPMKDKLQISSLDNSTISKVEILNLSGQLIWSIDHVNSMTTELNSQLATGSYFIMITTDKHVYTSKLQVI